MKQSEKREFEDNELVKRFLRDARENFGENSVTRFIGDDGSVIIRLTNSVSKMERKDHSLPEYLRKQGD